MKIERKDDVPSFYAESLQMVHSIAGFKMIVFKDKAEYALESGVGPDALIPRSIVKEIITEVSFSPQQFKILLRIISDQLKAYESRFGEIAIPEQGKKQGDTTGKLIAPPCFVLKSYQLITSTSCRKTCTVFFPLNQLSRNEKAILASCVARLLARCPKPKPIPLSHSL